MYNSVSAPDLRAGNEFLYGGGIQVIVKSEINIFGIYDVWYKPVEFKNVACPANGHLELEPNTALLCRD